MKGITDGSARCEYRRGEPERIAADIAAGGLDLVGKASLCGVCGWKRCPKALDHRRECVGCLRLPLGNGPSAQFDRGAL